MIGRMLSVGLDTNPIIVTSSSQMPKYLSERYLDMFVKYTGTSTTEYENGYIYRVSRKLEGLEYVYFFAPYFYLEALDNPADSSKVLDGYQAYNDKGKKLEGQYKVSDKVITENGTYYPADDGVNAYSQVTVNVGEGVSNPYIATTDAEMDAYLAAEYKDSFVRMDYAKYRMALPAAATLDTAKYTCENIGISRMCSYIDKWLGDETEKTVLNLRFVGENTVDHIVKACKALNADGTYAYVLILEIGAGGINQPFFVYNVPFGATIGGVTFDMDGVILDGGFFCIKNVDYSAPAALNADILPIYFIGTTATYTVAVSDALILTNMAGSEVDNKYVEGAVYKVTAKYTEKNTYVAESPFEVGDALAGATVYLNQQITSDEFESMCEELAKTTDFGDLDDAFVFANVDYPVAEDSIEGFAAIVAPMALLVAGIGKTTTNGVVTSQRSFLNSYSLIDSDGHGPVILGKKNDGSSVSPATPASFTVASTIDTSNMDFGGITSITVPETITKINFPSLLNAIAGKTANFTKSTVIETNYVLEQQLSNGVFEEAQSETQLDAKATNDNIGKIYQYTGATGEKYINQALYIVMED